MNFSGVHIDIPETQAFQLAFYGMLYHEKIRFYIKFKFEHVSDQ